MFLMLNGWKKVGKSKNEFFDRFDKIALAKAYKSTWITDEEKKYLAAEIFQDRGAQNGDFNLDGTDTPTDFAINMVLDCLERRALANGESYEKLRQEYIAACGYPPREEIQALQVAGKRFKVKVA